jgi:serine/threonine protein kinase
MKQTVPPDRVLPLFSQILNGVEAAHLQGITHRDLKPENILYGTQQDVLVVADFGIAEFTQEDLYNAVETHTGERIASFMYAAPEQKERGKTVDRRADIYALGLMLNEFFTGQVLQGTAFTTIKARAPQYEYLDEIVDRMVRQLPSDRSQQLTRSRES